MSSWDVARLTVRLGDHNIKINSEVRHIEKRVKRVVRHRGFDSRTLVSTNVHYGSHNVLLKNWNILKFIL
jgi:acetolactate synthase regulatory subunit